MKECYCSYCKKTGGFPLLWRLTKYHDRLWYEVPKNGSMTIKKTFRPIRIPYENILPEEHEKNLRPIMIYRDPVERFVSLFKHYFTEKGSRFKEGTGFLDKMGFDRRDDLKETFQFVLDNLDEIGDKEEIHHFYPQTRFVELDRFENFHWIRMDKLSRTLNVGIEHHTEFDGDIILSEFQLDTLKNVVYAEDYEMFEKLGLKL